MLVASESATDENLLVASFAGVGRTLTGGCLDALNRRGTKACASRCVWIAGVLLRLTFTPREILVGSYWTGI